MRYVWWYVTWILTALLLRGGALNWRGRLQYRKIAKQHPEYPDVRDHPDEQVASQARDAWRRWKIGTIWSVFLALPVLCSWGIGIDTWAQNPRVAWIVFVCVAPVANLPILVYAHSGTATGNAKRSDPLRTIGWCLLIVAAAIVGVVPFLWWK